MTDPLKLQIYRRCHGRVRYSYETELNEFPSLILGLDEDKRMKIRSETRTYFEGFDPDPASFIESV